MATAKKPAPRKTAKKTRNAPNRGEKQGSKSIEAAPRVSAPGLSELKRKPTTKPADKKPAGRPTAYSEQVSARICERIAMGESLVNICKDDKLPSRATVMRWLHDDNHEGFRDSYARAREAQADFYAEQIIEISDEECTTVKHGDGDEEKEVEVAFDSAAVARNRLRVDARKWYASKVAPKKYGDKMALGQADDLDPLTVVVKKYSECGK